MGEQRHGHAQRGLAAPVRLDPVQEVMPLPPAQLVADLAECMKQRVGVAAAGCLAPDSRPKQIPVGHRGLRPWPGTGRSDDAAILAGMALGDIARSSAGALPPVATAFWPNPSRRTVCDRLYAEFPKLYKSQKAMFGRLNRSHR
jgi:hypothetical protein